MRRTLYSLTARLVIIRVVCLPSSPAPTARGVGLRVVGDHGHMLRVIRNDLLFPRWEAGLQKGYLAGVNGLGELHHELDDETAFLKGVTIHRHAFSHDALDGLVRDDLTLETDNAHCVAECSQNKEKQ